MARSAASNRLVTRDMGKSGSFNGTSTYCTVPITPSLTAFSVAFWVKIGNGNANNARILDWQDGGPLNGFTVNLGLTGSRLAIVPVFSNAVGNLNVFNIYTAVPGDWSHHVLTYEPNNMNWYVNGTLFETDTSGTMTAATQTLTLGRRSASGANFFKGLIDGFVFLNGRAMNATEVATLYTSGVHPSDTSCHIRFNDNVNDETANANNLTANNITYSTDVVVTTRTATTGPYRKTVENLVANGDFEYAPAFTAATTSFPVWIDGTSSGSSFSRTYNWGIINKTGSGQAQFDNTQSYSGKYSLKVSTTATGSLFRCTNTLTGKDFVDCAVLPSTSYTISYCMKTTANSGSATSGAGLDAREWNGAGAVVTTNVIGTPVTTTTNWTKYSATFTTASTARFIQIRPQVIGNDGTGTLIMDAWFDDITLTTTAPYRNRKSIDNLVENGDFESVPTFTAATNTANRYIDGTAAGLNATEFPYRWFAPGTFANATAQYDTSVKLTGTASMKLSTTTTAGLASALYGNNTSATNIKLTMIPVLPSTSYTVSGYCKTNNVAAASAHIDIYEYNGAGTLGATNTTNTLTGTNDWTLVTVTFTTASTARYLALALRNHVAGNVSDAWFDNIVLT